MAEGADQGRWIWQPFNQQQQPRRYPGYQGAHPQNPQRGPPQGPPQGPPRGQQGPPRGPQAQEPQHYPPNPQQGRQFRGQQQGPQRGRQGGQHGVGQRELGQAVNPKQQNDLQQAQQRQAQHRQANPGGQKPQQKSDKHTQEEQVIIDPRYRKLTCFNCGEPGHFVGICTKPKVCFICAIPGHYMTNCPKWKEIHPVATFVGSANRGLGFYHVEVPQIETTQWLNFQNCGVVRVIEGEIDITELEKELSEIYCREWPWQIRDLENGQFLVRFPPHKKVADIKNYPSFNLRKAGVKVEVLEWIGELDPFEELQETWVQISGIPPKWCAWSVFAQIASSFGLITEVDWSSMFKSFYEKVRVKIACRDPRKIPFERLYELDKKLYKVYFFTEDNEQEQQGENGQEGGNDDDGDDGNGDDYDQYDDLDEFGSTDPQMDVDQSTKTKDKSICKEPSSPNPQKGSKTVGFSEEATLNEEDAIGKQLYEIISEGVKKEQEEQKEEQYTPTQVDLRTEGEKSDEQKSRWEQFLQGDDNEFAASRCAQLLKSMELMSSDSESDEEVAEEMVYLNKKDIDNWPTKKNLMSTLKKCAEEEAKSKTKEDVEEETVDKKKKEKAPKQWGPTVAIRKSQRNKDDGRTALEKAEDYIKQKNLEEMKLKAGKEVGEESSTGMDGDEDDDKMEYSMQKRRRGGDEADRWSIGVCSYKKTRDPSSGMVARIKITDRITSAEPEDFVLDLGLGKEAKDKEEASKWELVETQDGNACYLRAKGETKWLT